MGARVEAQPQPGVASPARARCRRRVRHQVEDQMRNDAETNGTAQQAARPKPFSTNSHASNAAPTAVPTECENGM